MFLNFAVFFYWAGNKTVSISLLRTKPLLECMRLADGPVKFYLVRQGAG